MLLKALIAAAVLSQSPYTPGTETLHWVTSDGVTFQVKGWLDDKGMVRYWPDAEYNKRARAEALAVQKLGQGAKGVANYGLDSDRVADAARKPQPVSKHDSKPKLHVTVIGPESERGKVAQDLGERQGATVHPLLAPYRDLIYFQEYSPDDWAVNPKLGFQTQGRPTIMIQQANGREVYRAQNYDGGPESLAKVLAVERRKADPDYDPSKTPGPWSKLCPLGFSRQDWPIVLLAGGAIVLLLAIHPKKASGQ